MVTVKQVAALTGVAESTLRVWERRYRIVRPERSPGGYRLYDDAQVTLLRQMAALVRSGVPASVAAATVRDAGGEPAAQQPEGLPDGDELLAAAAAMDPDRLAAVIERAFAAGTFEQVADRWILPQLRALGDAWAAGRLSIAQEHFASAALMRAISAVFDRSGRDGNGPTVVVGLPAGDRHELALLAFAACLRRRGVAVAYLGADVPTTEWVQAACGRGVRAVVIGVTSASTVAGAQAVVDLLSAMSPPVSVWAGGSHRGELGGVQLLPDAVSEAAAQLHLALVSGRT